LKGCRDKEDIEHTLQNLPKGLDATYDRILENIQNEKDKVRVRLVLQFVAVASKPLTLDMIVEALMVDCESETINPKKRIRDPNAILEMCSNLLELYESSGEGWPPSHLYMCSNFLEVSERSDEGEPDLHEYSFNPLFRLTLLDLFQN
jgi:hypothetical protein